MHTGPSGRREAFRGPSWQRGWGSECFRGSSSPSSDSPVLTGASITAAAPAHVSPGRPVPTRAEGPQSRANRTERPGEQGFGSNCRRAVGGAGGSPRRS